jgi:predicted AAA+ superfamily ATPase
VDLKPVAGKATICIGVHRSGKSTLMFQRMQHLLDKGTGRQNILYLNFFDDRLHGLQHDGLGVILEAYFSLYPEKKNAEQIYCFFDEIQVISDWEPFVDHLMRTEKCEVYITGSSAQMLSREIATQMRIKIHQEYFNAMLFRDLVERHDIPHPKAVVDLAHWLIDNTASLYSINNLTGYLKALGHKAPKSAVSDYLAWFEDAYIVFTVRIFDASLARANVNPKKIYCIDHALVTSVSSGILINNGHLLENMVFIALRRTTPDIFYYKCKSGREVDFIVQGQGRFRMLIQVCESLVDPQTRKREVTALSEAMAELQMASGTIVTRSEDGQIQTESGKIDVVPAWRFLLNLSATAAKAR